MTNPPYTRFDYSSVVDAFLADGHRLHRPAAGHFSYRWLLEWEFAPHT